MGRKPGRGEVYNRRVTKHIETVLPETIFATCDYSFGGDRILDRETTASRPAGAECELRAYVGDAGQIVVLERTRLWAGDDTVWACQNKVQRTLEVDSPSMTPFTYDVQTRIMDGADWNGNRKHVSVNGFTDQPVYGGREVQAAVLLAETLANRKEPRTTAGDTACHSLHGLPSLARMIDSGRYVALSWEEMNELLGPNADTIAAGTTIDELKPEARKKAEQKGMTIFTETDPSTVDTRSGRTRETGPADEERATEGRLPDDVDPSEARAKLEETVREIRQMKSDE